jgi:hypothetical protein
MYLIDAIFYNCHIYTLRDYDNTFNLYNYLVIRASIPKLMLDDAFEQKNEIAKAVEEELEKATIQTLFLLVSFPLLKHD